MKDSRPIVTATAHTLPFEKLSPRDFERLCLWLVEREGYERAEHLGAAGSEQGRDVIAWRGGELWAFQCKRVQSFHAKQALAEVEKVLALPVGRRPAGLVFLVTCDVAANARQGARDRCREAGLACDFWTGTELDLRVKRHPDIVAEFFAGEDSLAVGNMTLAEGATVVFAKEGATVVIGEAPVAMTAVERESALGRYLHHVISRNRYLQLQGIRSGGRLVHIELDQIYVTLRATRQRLVQGEEAWLEREVSLAPGELGRRDEGHAPAVETVTVSVDEALAEHSRLVVLGDPGSGKTTLLRYLALLYARDLAEGTSLVRGRLGLEESGRLPVLLALRQIGAYLRAHHPADDGTEGCGLFLDFLLQSLKNERLALPAGFFEEWLSSGRAVVLFDGLDEVADPDLRRRVSRLVEAFTRAYPACRYTVTSRIVGYAGSARLGEGYAPTTVRDFTLADVERFLVNWHRLVAAGQMGPGDSAEAYAAGQTGQLLQGIKGNERIRELAINPLMLTVIAMVHRDRVKLPDRRAELYAEAVDVLLGKWDEARGVQETPVLEGQPFDTGDRRLMLQNLALHMHDGQHKEIAAGDLRRWLGQQFRPLVGDWRAAERAVNRFLAVIEERTGLLVARGEGVYAFSHLTFQEYLAALAVAGREDYIAYTLARAPDPWWREVILLESGYLSLQSKERTTRLIRTIAEGEKEPEPFHNLVLAAECLRDVGGNRVEGNLEVEVLRRLRADLNLDLRQEIERRRPRSGWEKLRQRLQREEGFEERAVVQEVLARRAAATQALVRAGAGYWKPLHGEPEWNEIPAGEFWMGTSEQRIAALLSRFGGEQAWYESESPQRRVRVPVYAISRVPITNAQYRLFTEATGHPPPGHWEAGGPPKGIESHPVVYVSWHDALAYCRWLGQMTGKGIALPSEAQWEKAARGHQDQREFPWGDAFEATRCNSAYLRLGNTTPVGIFPEGASPYGVLDMSGNVWEWCQTKWQGNYQAYADDNDPEGDAPRVLRGGAFDGYQGDVRCAYRYGGDPHGRDYSVGFRVVVAPVPSGL
jgi:formylglycine-generating enzyme required for sulfatase activity/energy-coupling factor transporter ATP-binding protein EcfA2